MAAIDYLKSQGFNACLNGNRLKVFPASKLTPDLRAYIKLHRIELLAEVAANDGEARRNHWRVTRPGGFACTMVGQPVTHAEALATARLKWPDAEVAND